MTKNKKIFNILIDVLLIVLALICFILPSFIKTSIGIILGVIFIIIACAFFLNAFINRTSRINSNSLFFLIAGIIAMILAIVLFIAPDTIVKTIGVIFAIFIILNGVYKLLFVHLQYRLNSPFWIVNLIIGILYIVLGSLIFVYLDNVATIFIYLLGAYLLLIGISRLIDVFNKKSQDIEFKTFKFNNHNLNDDHQIESNVEYQKENKNNFDNETEIIDAEFKDKD